MRRFNPILAAVPCVVATAPAAVPVPPMPESSTPTISPSPALSPVEIAGPRLLETEHTRHKHKLFVVQLGIRVERALYEQVNQRARALGGYYSKYRREGAIPGFIFRSREPAETLLAVVQERLGKAVAAVQIDPPPTSTSQPIPAWRRRIRA